MRMLLIWMLTSILSGTVVAQERVARVGEWMWRDSGPYCDTTHRGFVVALGEQGFVEGRAQAVLMTLTSTRRGLEREYAQAALKYRLPVMSDARYAVPMGALMNYGPDLGDVFRCAGNHVGRALKGEKPAEMPVEEPSRFILSLNLKTAKVLGLTLPAGVMVLADEVIE